MSKAEEFINDCTRNCSNEYIVNSKNDGLGGYVSRRKFNPWLTPDEARKVVEIAKEEIMEKTLDFFKERLYKSGYVGIMDLCDDYIKVMKDE